MNSYVALKLGALVAVLVTIVVVGCGLPTYLVLK